MTTHQSKIEKLIAELCPNGVEFRELGEITHFMNGKGHEKHIVENGKYTVVNSKFVSTEGRVKKYSLKQISPVLINDVLMVMSDLPNGKALAKCFYVDESGKYTLNQRVCSLTVKDNDELNAKYLLYILNRNKQLLRYDSGADQTNLKKDDILKIKIPVPPLAIQQEIVKILDTFTTLEAELEAELEARKKQYEHYREELLTFGEDTILCTLSDVAHFMNGKGHEKHIDESGKYIVVNSKFVSTEGRVKKYSAKQISPVLKNDILMVMSDLPNGKALAKCFYVDEDDKYTLNQRICALTVKDNKELNAKFLCYILNRNKQLLRYDSGADQTNLRKDDILNIAIPIPSFAEQERIVSILDKFDALANDISIGLPAELNARRKQYEYYRGKLLNFSEKAAI